MYNAMNFVLVGFVCVGSSKIMIDPHRNPTAAVPASTLVRWE